MSCPPLDIGHFCVYRGELGTIIDAPCDPDKAWWVIELQDGTRHAPFAGDPYLAPLNRPDLLRAILNSVAARHLDTERAAQLIETIGIP
jgi:hypothetical protein